MKYKLRNQFTLIFGLLMAGTVLLCWFVNITFSERYYTIHKQAVLIGTYRQINHALTSGDIGNEGFDITLQKLCDRNNISVIILDTNLEIIKTFNNPPTTRRQLMDKIFRAETGNVERVLARADNYNIWIDTDYQTQTEFIEMWGWFDNGNYFLFRSAMEGIQDSVALANRFLGFVGMAAVLLSSFVIYFVSKKTTDPIKELTEISERMIHLDFEAKYTGRSKNEVALLGQNINELSRSLEKTISELKSANNELLRDLQRKNEVEAMRSEFLSNVSHELKTPIALIQGYAEGLIDGVSSDQESRDYYCEVIVDEAAKMNEVVKKLLTLNELEFGKSPIVMERFDIVQMIENYLQSVAILPKQRQIEIEFAGGEAVYVWADEYKVLEVLNNYFTNALNHSPDGGRIVIGLTAGEGTIRVAIWNRGEHINEENIPFIWDKFYKVDKARTRTYGGSGIGLSIVKAIMEAMNQGYGVRNFEEGVEFWFELARQ
jgi:signal transduction histidine kinase